MTHKRALKKTHNKTHKRALKKTLKKVVYN